MLFDKLLALVSRVLPERQIVIDGELYLQRFYLWGKMPPELAALWNCGTIPKQRFGSLPTTYLHCFHKPDKDRDCHNHPWHAEGRILTGGYLEERWVGHPSERGAYKVTVVRSPGDEQRLTPDTFHRVSDLLALRVWTYFSVGPYEQSWGYWCEKDNCFVHHRARHADPNTD